MTVESVWIRTGEAATILGYSRDHFREKFIDLIPHRRFPSGQYQWSREVVLRLASQAVLREPA